MNVCTDSRLCVITHIHIHISFPAVVIIRQCTLRFFGRISSFIQQMWGQELLAVPCGCIHTWPIRPGLKRCGCSNCLSLCRPVCRLSSINKRPHICKYSRGERVEHRTTSRKSSLILISGISLTEMGFRCLRLSGQHGGSPAHKLGTWQPQLHIFRKIMSDQESAEAFETLILKETYHRDSTHRKRTFAVGRGWKRISIRKYRKPSEVLHFHNYLSSFT